MNQADNIDTLISHFLEHDKKALARLITLAENDPEIARIISSKLRNHSHNSYILGLTGSPGTGKSTLINKLVEFLSDKGFKIGVISVDPTSPYGEGAFLGDRVRMREIILEPNVFIRSVASRGSLGGLSKAVFDIAKLYDAYGMDYIIVETVGAGQSEIDIYNLAYTIILVTVPGLGDSVQVQKAGILEIADILVINKSDLGGDFLKINLNMMLESYTRERGWRPPIIRTIAKEGEGITELFQAIQDHREHVERSGQLNEMKRTHIQKRIQVLIESLLFKQIIQKISMTNEINKATENVLSESQDIYSAVYEILKPFFDKIEKIQ
ncbi:MAG TPA: methylmalonyl Co-A mutase-associated GTPase MeaB [Candidatus Deferrimicrobium sp.]|nr:methylmalonyl Co-A mutase-associated GTPase MeaB [Candidatus Deferrimicrobium sp.]